MKVLVAGIGNIFLGDDGFGVEVVRRLSSERVDTRVSVADFGIRGIHLAYELADGGYDAAILVDAVSRGREPGTLYVIEPDLPTAPSHLECADAHSLTPDVVLALLQQLGRPVQRIVIVGCEPATLEESMSLSPAVAASVDAAVAAIHELLAEMTGAMPCA